jgi:UV DNA damage endonuclease
MAFRFGYVSQNYTIEARTGRTFRLENLSAERLVEAARGNFEDLAKVLAWNKAHGIGLFRLASGIISFASHPSCTLPWAELLHDDLKRAAQVIRETGARISSHPGQYTVLTSPRAEVVAASLAELEYHARLFDLLETSFESRILLHVGGVHGDKPAAMKRFVLHARDLSPSALGRLTLEGWLAVACVFVVMWALGWL